MSGDRLTPMASNHSGLCSSVDSSASYHRMSPKHLNRYVQEFSGRHNNRSFDTIDQMSAMVRGMCNKTLTYKELIK